MDEAPANAISKARCRARAHVEHIAHMIPA